MEISRLSTLALMKAKTVRMVWDNLLKYSHQNCRVKEIATFLSRKGADIKILKDSEIVISFTSPFKMRALSM